MQKSTKIKKNAFDNLCFYLLMKSVKYLLKIALSTAFLKKIKNYLLKTNNSPKPNEKL